MRLTQGEGVLWMGRPGQARLGGPVSLHQARSQDQMQRQMAADRGKKWLLLVPQCSRLVKPQIVKRSAAGANVNTLARGGPRGDGRTFKHGMPGQ